MKGFNTLVATAILVCAAPAAAAPGDLDPAFGEGGRVTTSFGAGAAAASDIVVQPDGRIVVAGGATVGTQRDFAIARYLPNGALDPSFSDDGKVTTPVGPGDQEDLAYAVTVQPDGKIVAAGRSAQFAVVRYNADGTLDETFSGDGRQTVEIGDGESAADDVAIDVQGRIVLVGEARSPSTISRSDVGVARLDLDGRLDTSFSDDGMYTADPTGDGVERYAAVAPLADGGFTATGSAYPLGSPAPLLAVDRFAADGKVVTGPGESPAGRLVRTGADIQILPDGRVVIVGNTAGAARVGVARFLPDGRYDPSFSEDGEDAADIVVGASGFVGAAGVAVQPTGGIVVGVIAYRQVSAPGGRPDDSAFGLLRFRPGGRLDPSFGGDGRQATTFTTGPASLQAIALQGSRILAAGTVELSTDDSTFALAAYDGGVVDSAPEARRNRGPDSTIRRLARRLPARRPLVIRGSARDDERVTKVEVALLRVRPQRQGRQRCQWLRNRRSAFVRRAASRRTACVRSRRFVRTRGTRRWRLALPSGLPAGRYVVYSRATDNNGARERRFSARDRNRVAFTVRRF